MTTLDHSATLDPRGLEEAADEIEGFTVPGVPARMIAKAAITAYLAVAQPIVETEQALKDLPVGVVVRSAAGTIACRADESAGVVFGEERPFPWTSLMLPARVIWRPHESP